MTEKEITCPVKPGLSNEVSPVCIAVLIPLGERPLFKELSPDAQAQVIAGLCAACADHHKNPAPNS